MGQWIMDSGGEPTSLLGEHIIKFTPNELTIVMPTVPLSTLIKRAFVFLSTLFLLPLTYGN